MKRCPNCNQTFEEDWLSFCTQDGTTLIDEPAASNEPPPTLVASVPPEVSLPEGGAGWNRPPDVYPERQWQPPPAPAWQPPPALAGGYGTQQSRALANAAMAIGIVSITVGWLCLGPVPAIVAIILGAVALSQMKKNPERIGGKQAAWVGIITGGVTVVIYVIFMIIYIAAIIASKA